MALNLANAMGEDERFESFLCATREEGALHSSISDKVTYIFLKRKRLWDQVFNLTKRKILEEAILALSQGLQLNLFLDSVMTLRLHDLQSGKKKKSKIDIN